ncbi:uncharacterized protein LOC130446193 [Diorhabda sublineata]|uniref:uncharacterized protein LOC130446193 n=1 Tax=Diorhabda sublineata TaxID=1163346 RepID=UPI0024E0905E|nr:uncharacterized protein LOC130446193 [Diorhabda sublineata]
MLLFVFGVCFFGNVAAEASSNYFCADMNPQHHVMIDQLMGMWFGIEKINHLDEVFHTKTEFSCPIIHISEDRDATSTFNPLYSNYNYGYNYGRAHGYGSVTDKPISAITDRATVNEIRRRVYEDAEYDRQTTYGNYPYNKKQHLYDLKQMAGNVKYLRVIWDENGESTEYRVRYNVSRSGFWITSGPENGGASLDPQYSHFGGTIQVVKAVGNHMVLTFCHQLPDRQLYSILLSRELKLENVEIHGVHNMLNRKGLRTNSVKKTCNSSSNNRINVLIFVPLFIFSLFTLRF